MVTGSSVHGVFRTRLATCAARNPHRTLRFLPDGSALQTMEGGRPRLHVLRGASTFTSTSTSTDRRELPPPLTRLYGHVRGGHVLEVRRESGWSCEAGADLVGFESCPGFELFASAFDDQGTTGAVLARCTRTGTPVVIVFPEPDPLI